MRHWINSELGAVNVTTVPVDPAIVDEFQALARASLDEAKYACVTPSWNSDIRWISANSEQAFRQFESAFDRLRVARAVEPFLDLDKQVRLYAGYLVVRSLCSAPSFHADWVGGTNQGFTMITPVSDNAEDFGLIYKKANGTLGEYSYRRGEAIVFGDHFVHSTAPGRSEKPVVLLSFSFGTDKMAYWSELSKTVGYQSVLLRRPDGMFCRNEDCPGLVTTSN